MLLASAMPPSFTPRMNTAVDCPSLLAVSKRYFTRMRMAYIPISDTHSMTICTLGVISTDLLSGRISNSRLFSAKPSSMASVTCIRSMKEE